MLFFVAFAGLPRRGGRSPGWIKVKNPKSPAMNAGQGCVFMSRMD